MISVKGISKEFRVAKRGKGVASAIGSLFHREYTVVKALNNVSFEVDEGEIIGYIGPNGAGKSTSIKVMSGILTPDSGDCKVIGFTPWKERKAYVGRIGVVFGQRTQLWWDVPVQDSFELLRSIYKIPPERFTRNMDMLCTLLGLEELLATPLRQLSLGQRMRCEIAASLIHSPSVLFLDEPTIGLDAVSKLKVRDFIKQLNKETGVTVILTTHDMNDIEALTDRIVLIGKGSVLYDGSMNEIRRKYDTERTLEIAYSAGGGLPAIPDGVVLESMEGGRAVFRVDTGKCGVSEVIFRLGQVLSIQDINISSRLVEEIIADLYRQYDVS